MDPFCIFLMWKLNWCYKINIIHEKEAENDPFKKELKVYFVSPVRRRTANFILLKHFWKDSFTSFLTTNKTGWNKWMSVCTSSTNPGKVKTLALRLCPEQHLSRWHRNVAFWSLPIGYRLEIFVLVAICKQEPKVATYTTFTGTKMQIYCLIDIELFCVEHAIFISCFSITYKRV